MKAAATKISCEGIVGKRKPSEEDRGQRRCVSHDQQRESLVIPFLKYYGSIPNLLKLVNTKKDFKKGFHFPTCEMSVAHFEVSG